MREFLCMHLHSSVNVRLHRSARLISCFSTIPSGCIYFILLTFISVRVALHIFFSLLGIYKERGMVCAARSWHPRWDISFSRAVNIWAWNLVGFCWGVSEGSSAKWHMHMWRSWLKSVRPAQTYRFPTSCFSGGLGHFIVSIVYTRQSSCRILSTRCTILGLMNNLCIRADTGIKWDRHLTNNNCKWKPIDFRWLLQDPSEIDV